MCGDGSMEASNSLEGRVGLATLPSSLDVQVILPGAEWNSEVISEVFAQ